MVDPSPPQTRTVLKLRRSIAHEGELPSVDINPVPYNDRYVVTVINVPELCIQHLQA